MKTVISALLAVGLLLAPTFATAALAQGPNDHPTRDEDLGIQLTDMFAAVASVLAMHQDQTANEGYIGSASASHRLRSAILRVPAVSVRGARPFVEGLIIGDD